MFVFFMSRLIDPGTFTLYGTAEPQDNKGGAIKRAKVFVLEAHFLPEIEYSKNAFATTNSNAAFPFVLGMLDLQDSSTATAQQKFNFLHDDASVLVVDMTGWKSVKVNTLGQSIIDKFDFVMTENNLQNTINPRDTLNLAIRKIFTEMQPFVGSGITLEWLVNSYNSKYGTNIQP